MTSSLAQSLSELDVSRVAQHSKDESLNLPQYEIDLPENKRFVGRVYALNLVNQMLVRNLGTQSETLACAIFGAAGVGKTQTALKFAYTHKSTFRSILWVSSETRCKLLQGLSKYAVRLGLVAPGSNSDPVRDADILKQWYESTETPWLLIFDNAVDVRVILDYWPQSKWGAILVTTQKPIFAGRDICGKGFQIFGLDEDSAIKLLQTSIHDRDLPPDTEQARMIVQRVGCLPVAIRTCIGQMNEADCTIAEYNKEWSTLRSIISDSDVKHVNSRHARYGKGLKDLYAQSIEDLDRDAKTLLHIFSLMDDYYIPEELVRHDFLQKQFPFLKHRAKVLGDLTESSLVGKEVGRPGPEIPPKRYLMHRVTRVFIQMQMTADQRQAAFDSAAALLNFDVVAKPGDPGLTDNGTYFQHVQALRDYYESEVNEIRPVDGGLVASMDFIQLLRKTSWWCYRVSRFGPALRFIETINAIHDQPENHPVVPSSGVEFLKEMVWNYLLHGSILTELGKSQEALHCFRKALSSCKSVEANGNYCAPMLRAVYGGMGKLYSGLRRYPEAEHYFRESLDLVPNDGLLPDYEIDLCVSLSEQGASQLEEASSRLGRFIARREEEYGKEDKVDYLLGRAFWALGNVRIIQAKDPKDLVTQEQRDQWLEEASMYHSKSLDNWKSTHGDEHHATADAWVRCAWHKAERSDYETAIDYLERAIKIYQSASNMGYRQPEIARANTNSIWCLKSKGKQIRLKRPRQKPKASEPGSWAKDSSLVQRWE